LVSYKGREGFENTFLKKVSVPERKEISSRLRKTGNGELHGLYCTPNVSWVLKSRMRWTEHVARMAETINEYKVHGESVVNRQFGRSVRRWEYIQHNGVEAEDCVNLYFELFKSQCRC